MEGNQERLAKVLARHGVASRREAERWIADGRVTVNGEVVDGREPVDPSEADIRVDGKPLPAPPPLVYFVLNKVRGTITTRDDPEGRRTVLDDLELPHRVEPVGRLDFDTEGALLLTNDGELAHALTHPRREIPKRYLAKVYRTPDERDLRAIEQGVNLEDGRTSPAKVRVLEATERGNAWLEITVTEGRNRLIRRMMGALGHPVSKLRRESFATISVRGMERGAVRPLTGEEVGRLKDLVAGVKPARAGRKSRKGFAKAKPKLVKPNHKKRAREERARRAGRRSRDTG